MHSFYETKQNLTTEYRKVKKTKGYVLYYWLIIIVIVVGFFLYANDSKASRTATEDRFQKLEQSIEERFDSIDENFKRQDNKIEGAKEARAKQKAEEAALAAARQSLANKRVQLPRVSGDCEQYRGLVAQYSWNVETVLAIMKAESGCNPNAANLNDNHRVCMGSFGLLQISCHGGRILDPAANIAAGYAKYVASGYSPWTVCRTIVRCI